LCISWLTASRSCAQSAREVSIQLEAFKTNIAAEVTAELQRTNFATSYTTVWRAYEDGAIDALCEILPRHIPALTATNFDRGKSGREKNRLADLAVICGTNLIEISIKAARSSANPENDMGTFHEHPERKRIFSGSFTLWVRYADDGRIIRCDRAFFEPTWRLTGRAAAVDGVKYRKKDGNMRPKPWTMFESGAAFWKSEDEFEAAVKRSESFRANEIIKEYLGELSEGDQRMLYERLREKFAAPAQK
jgi:hypothetical protein